MTVVARLLRASVLLLAAVNVFAQTFGSITGEVKDSTGATVQGAVVTVTSKETNAVRTLVTNESGIYSFPSLLPGAYEVSVKKEGFRSVSRSDVTLQVQQTARLDFDLQVGQVSEVVEVTGGAPLLATEDATVGTVIENKRIVELPLNGRNFLQLVALAPNMNVGFAISGDVEGRQGGLRAQQNISIGGQRTSFNHYSLDGSENTDVNFNTPVLIPSIDALLEFKVQSGIYPAEFGRGYGQVNVSTKSGGNQYHGALFEFLRNSALDAKPYAFSASRPPKIPFRWNQYGFVLNGPVVIPKLFNGRNRLFFTSNFEGYRERTQLQQLFTVPTEAWRRGDLSGVANRIYDPATRVQTGSVITAQPFANNTIPTARIHPLSTKYFEFFPLPNLPGVANNYMLGAARPIDRDQFLQRIDLIESQNSSWFGRYSWGDDSQTNPGLKLNGTTLASTVRQAMINNTRTLSPSKVNEFRFAYSHLFNTTGPELAFQRNVVSEYNMQGVVATTPSGYAPPGVAIGGCCSAGGAPGVFTNFNHTFQWVDNFSWVRGRHSLRFGGEIRRDRFNQIGNQFLSPQFNFDPLGTLNPASPAGTGFGFGDYLLGIVRQSQFALTAANAQFRATSQYYYIDDTWKVGPNLTLTLGLRYENTPPWVDRTGTMMNLSISDWAFGQTNVAANRHPVLVRAGKGDFYAGTFLRFDPAIQVARDGRLGDRLIRSDNNDFAPRIGLAWSPTSKWTFRTGFGVFYSQDQGNGRFDLSRNIAGRRQEIANPDFPNLTFDKPFAAPAGTVTISVPTIFSSALNRRTPYTMEWLLNVQRELGQNTALEIGYIGSGSRRLEYLMFQNKAVPAPLGSGSVVSRRAFPEFGNAQYVTNDANASYQALSGKITHRYSGGFTYLASYTYSRAIDMGSGIRVNANDGTFPQNNACLSCERGLSTFHVPHRIAGSALYELPFGKGRAYLGSSRVANVILGGWQVGSLLTLQAGSPFTLRAGADQANTGRDDDRPSSTGRSALLPRGKQDPQMWFDKTQFTLAPYGTFGNVGRSTGMTAGIIAWDFSTLKNIPIHEAHQLQFRFEAFNLPNHANFGMPDAILSSATFARVTSTRTNMRSLQFGLKYLF